MAFAAAAAVPAAGARRSSNGGSSARSAFERSRRSPSAAATTRRRRRRRARGRRGRRRPAPPPPLRRDRHLAAAAVAPTPAPAAVRAFASCSTSPSAASVDSCWPPLRDGRANARRLSSASSQTASLAIRVVREAQWMAGFAWFRRRPSRSLALIAQGRSCPPVRLQLARVERRLRRGPRPARPKAGSSSRRIAQVLACPASRARRAALRASLLISTAYGASAIEFELGHRRLRCAGRADSLSVLSLSGPLLQSNLQHASNTCRCAPTRKGTQKSMFIRRSPKMPRARRLPPYPQIRGVLATEHAP